MPTADMDQLAWQVKGKISTTTPNTWSKTQLAATMSRTQRQIHNHPDFSK
jgi:hypothetical protein